MKRLFISLCSIVLLGLPVLGNEVEDQYAVVKKAYLERAKNAQNDLKQYLRDYPYTTYFSSVQNMIGVLQVERMHYKQAVKTFNKVDWKQLERPEQPSFFFYRGIAYLKQNEFTEASSCFKALRKMDSPYATQAQFYYAYCWYLMEEYDKALPDLLALENTAEYKEIAPYIVTQIYYAQNHLDLAEPRARQLIEQYPNNSHNGDMERILGEIAFHEGRYGEVIERLERYEKSWKEQKRDLLQEDIYLLGMARMQVGQYDKAINDFKRIKLGTDSLSEKVYLNLGNAYIKVNNIEKAKLSYQAAMRSQILPRVREEAMFNYALCTYQTGTAIGEGIQAFNDFLKEYPNTEHAETVYEMLASLYMTSKNYSAALDAICAIKNPNAKLLETKQYLRYQLGADALLQGKNQEAVSWMSEVIQNDKGKSAYKTEALFFRAEARYRMKQYDAAMTDLILFRQQPSYGKSPNNSMADYLQGYLSFNMKKYPAAQGCFESYVAREDTRSNKALYSDALNRIGDCQFNARQFDAAQSTYQRVIELGKSGADYATFQRGYVLGLMHQYAEKVNTLEQLLDNFPKSEYCDDALYEIARAQLQQEKSMEAIAAYTRLVTTYPKCSYAKTASLERGMIYRNLGMYTEAVDAFRQTIQTYPATEQAYMALDGMEQVYVEQNNIGEYLTYTKDLSKLNMYVSSKEDSLTYAVGEKQYLVGNYQAAADALNNYISHFCPGGRHCLMAQNSAADCYYNLGEKDKALELYQVLAQQDNGSYSEEVYSRIAEIAYDKANYSLAYTYFVKLTSIGLKGQKLMNAKLGVLRTAFMMNNNESVIAIASDILADSEADNDICQEARYDRAKAYVQTEQYGQATTDLKQLAADVRLVEGAESKYLLAYIYFQQGRLDDSEKEIMSFAGMKTQHQYWLAKSIILLADINIQRSELFQAKQYLLTLQENYKGKDDIQSIVAAKLAEIEALEQPEETEEEEEQ